MLLTAAGRADVLVRCAGPPGAQVCIAVANNASTGCCSSWMPSGSVLCLPVHGSFHAWVLSTAPGPAQAVLSSGFGPMSATIPMCSASSCTVLRQPVVATVEIEPGSRQPAARGDLQASFLLLCRPCTATCKCRLAVDRRPADS